MATRMPLYRGQRQRQSRRRKGIVPPNGGYQLISLAGSFGQQEKIHQSLVEVLVYRRRIRRIVQSEVLLELPDKFQVECTGLIRNAPTSKQPCLLFLSRQEEALTFRREVQALHRRANRNSRNSLRDGAETDLRWRTARRWPTRLSFRWDRRRARTARTSARRRRWRCAASRDGD